MPARIEVVNGRHADSRLIVLREVEPRFTSSGKRVRRVECQCDCGSVVIVSVSDLRSGHTSSCGCLHREIVASLGRSSTTHGMTGSPTWNSWKSMLDRCYSENRSDSHIYKERGITVCDRWRTSFEEFFADMGERQSRRYSLERIDNDGHYEPGNCCWATPEQQGRNRRTNRLIEFDGRIMCLKDWSIATGIKYTALHQRLKAGWTIEESLTTPYGERRAK